jgi:hypothetical protein
MYADFDGLVDNMMREARTAHVNVIPLAQTSSLLKTRVETLLCSMDRTES